MALVIVALVVMFLLIKIFPPSKNWLLKTSPAGEGPSAAQRAQVTFKTTAVVEIKNPKAKKPRTIVATMAGGDGGYTQTAMVLIKIEWLGWTSIDLVV